MNRKFLARIGALFLAVVLAFLTACNSESPPNQSSQSGSEVSQDFSIPTGIAESYFSAVRKILDSDDGELWGQNLYGPMLIIDPETLDTVANEPDNEGMLTRVGNVYVGRFSEDAPVANSVATFGGKKWATVIWPLEQDETSRNILMIHEMFHNKQASDIYNSVYENSHMDTLEARISIQLELNALLVALKSEGEERLEAIQDALSIRYSRREQFSSGDSENKFEIHEGLPEYTAYKLSFNSTEELKDHIASEFMINFLAKASFVRNFAYFTVPIYGLFLDDSSLSWRQYIVYDTDLGDLLGNAYNLQGFDVQNTLTEEIRNKYGYAEIRDRELAIQQERDEIVAYYRDKFTARPTLIIPIIDVDNFSFSFNPHTVQHIPDLGTVYPTAEMIDTWGRLVVHEGGSLIMLELMQILVTAENLSIDESVITGVGWTLFLNDGYVVTSDGEGYIINNE